MESAESEVRKLRLVGGVRSGDWVNVTERMNYLRVPIYPTNPSLSPSDIDPMTITVLHQDYRLGIVYSQNPETKIEFMMLSSMNECDAIRHMLRTWGPRHGKR